MLRHRLTVGPILILGLVATLWLDGLVDQIRVPAWAEGLLPGRESLPRGTVIFLFALPIAFEAARELAGILRAKQITASTRITVGAAVAGLCVSVFVPPAERAIASVAVVNSAAALVLASALAFYSRNKTVEGVVAAAGGALLSFVYLGLMAGFFMAIRRQHTAWMLLWIIATVKSCDIGAFFSGMAFGKRKLIHWLSPGKTWEGLIGGAITSGVVGSVGAWALTRSTAETGPNWLEGLLAGILFGVIGQGGDLVASLFKRDAGRKDSGTMLPGFGGVLDVIDSPLLVAPVAYWFLASLVPAAG